MRLALSDPAASRAVILGVAQYRHLESLPAVRNNVEALHSIFTDQEIWGLAAANCTSVQDPVDATQVLDLIHEACQDATDTIFIYFAGHGIRDPGEERGLILAMPRTPRDLSKAFYTGLEYRKIHRQVRESPAKRKVLVLDCCYSGEAIQQWMSSEDNLINELDIAGTCVITSTASTRKALAPLGAVYTAFSGELISIFSSGVAGVSDLISMDDVFIQLKRQLRARGFPEPGKGHTDLGGSISIARNRAYDRSENRAVADIDAERETRNVMPEEAVGISQDISPAACEIEYIDPPYRPAIQMSLAIAFGIAILIGVVLPRIFNSKYPGTVPASFGLIAVASMSLGFGRRKASINWVSALSLLAALLWLSMAVIFSSSELKWFWFSTQLGMIIVAAFAVSDASESMTLYRSGLAKYEQQFELLPVVESSLWVGGDRSKFPYPDIFRELAKIPGVRLVERRLSAGVHTAFVALHKTRAVLCVYLDWPASIYSVQGDSKATSALIHSRDDFNRDYLDDVRYCIGVGILLFTDSVSWRDRPEVDLIFVLPRGSSILMNGKKLPRADVHFKSAGGTMRLVSFYVPENPMALASFVAGKFTKPAAASLELLVQLVARLSRSQ